MVKETTPTEAEIARAREIVAAEDARIAEEARAKKAADEKALYDLVTSDGFVATREAMMGVHATVLTDVDLQYAISSMDRLINRYAAG